MAFWMFASTAASDAGSDERMSSSIQPSNGIEFTDVPPPIRPTLNVVFGCFGTWSSWIFAMARPIAPIGLAHAERAEAVAAGALERHAIAMAADRDVGDVHAGAVDRHEAIDLILQRDVEQRLHAAQIAEPFFADVGDEGDRARRLDVGRLHLADDRDQHREAAAIVADAGPSQHGALALDLARRCLRETPCRDARRSRSAGAAPRPDSRRARCRLCRRERSAARVAGRRAAARGRAPLP